jgi:16S rRNA (uracil1498-N3)-methyltransferase
VNLVLLEPDEVGASGRARVQGRRAEHVRDVLGKHEGDDLRVGVIGGRIGRARIVANLDDALELDVILDRDPPPRRAVTLVLALPRPPVLRRVLQHVAALGIARLVLCQTARVEKSYWSSPQLAPAAMREQLCLGLEQAGDTVLPVLELQRRFRPLVEDVLAHAPKPVMRLVADPSASVPCPVDVGVPVVLVVGPEGGLVPFELELLAAAGFSAIGLGPRILRVETAVVALLARLAR